MVVAKRSSTLQSGTFAHRYTTESVLNPAIRVPLLYHKTTANPPSATL